MRLNPDVIHVRRAGDYEYRMIGKRIEDRGVVHILRDGIEVGQFVGGETISIERMDNIVDIRHFQTRDLEQPEYIFRPEVTDGPIDDAPINAAREVTAWDDSIPSMQGYAGYSRRATGYLADTDPDTDAMWRERKLCHSYA